jgi:hypothetical protein
MFGQSNSQKHSFPSFSTLFRGLEVVLNKESGFKEASKLLFVNFLNPVP